jgi:Endosomal/lysosomal potassium channel TMEM175
MPTEYHRVAGGGLARLAALRDGTFAVAMTLLVLELRVPAITARHVRPGPSAALPLRGLELLAPLRAVQHPGGDDRQQRARGRAEQVHPCLPQSPAGQRRP